MSEMLSLDKFLESQNKTGNLATIEPIEGKEELVKVTPWVAGVGCLCQFAITIPKKAVDSVRPTKDRHHCCGKVLIVAEVHFTKDSSINLNELFGQVMSVAQAGPLQPASAQEMIGSSNPIRPARRSQLYEHEPPHPGCGFCTAHCADASGRQIRSREWCGWGWPQMARNEAYAICNEQVYGLPIYTMTEDGSN